MDYIILTGETAEELEGSVKNHIQDGYQPQGGVSYSLCWYERGPDDRGFSESFAQAMTK